MDFLGMVVNLVTVLTLIKLLVLLVLSAAHVRRSNRHAEVTGYTPLVSVIVPCHNEEFTLANCIQSITQNSYQHYEIVIVNDGSTDNTANVAAEMAANCRNIKLITQVNGGKASALNRGIGMAAGEIVVCVDADSALQNDAITRAVSWFADSSISAVGGNVKVANKRNLLGLHQAAEYLSGLNVQRRSLDMLGGLTVIPGALGAFRKSVVKQIGGFSKDTKVEDMDLTIAIQKAGFRALYDPALVVFTEVPENLRDFLVQRRRWVYGAFRLVLKYRDLLFTRKGRRIGNIGLTSTLLVPLFDLAVSILYAFTILRLLFAADYQSLVRVIGLVSLTSLALGAYCLAIDHDSPRILLTLPLLGIWYHPLLSWLTLWAIIALVLRKQETHEVAKRHGKNSELSAFGRTSSRR